MTSFDDIYKRFAQKITDYKILELSDVDVEEMLYGNLLSAITKVKPITSDLSARDEILKTFTINLLDVEKEVLACLLVVEWITPQLNSTLYTNQFMGSKEDKFYAQSNQISSLRDMKKDMQVEARKLRRDYITDNSSYLHSKG
jgi:hypothetical protein